MPPAAFKVLGNKHLYADTEDATVSQTAFQLTLDFLTSKPVVVVPSATKFPVTPGCCRFVNSTSGSADYGSLLKP